jgi:hypothetical protein
LKIQLVAFFYGSGGFPIDAAGGWSVKGWGGAFAVGLRAAITIF